MDFSDFNLSKCADGLLPVVVQDAVTLKVLMLGYMNAEAYDKTVATGRVTFFSRTRQCLWTKGETSGHYLEVVSQHVDCDADTLLIRAIPHGPTCHRGTTACFDTPEHEGFMRHLFSVVQQRHREMPEGSYTTRLFIKGVKAIAQTAVKQVAEQAGRHQKGVAHMERGHRAHEADQVSGSARPVHGQCHQAQHLTHGVQNPQGRKPAQVFPKHTEIKEGCS